MNGTNTNTNAVAADNRATTGGGYEGCTCYAQTVVHLAVGAHRISHRVPEQRRHPEPRHVIRGNIFQRRMGGTLLMTPFGTPTLILLDSLRFVVIIGGFLLITSSVYMMAKTILPARWLLTAGLIGFVVSAIGTEIEHLGDHPTYRLFANLFGVVVALLGTWRARKEP